MKPIKSIILTLMLAACTSDEEPINTFQPIDRIDLVRYTLTELETGEQIIMEAGNEATKASSANLKTYTKYEGKLDFFNTETDEWQSVNNQILSSSDFYQVFFQTSSTLNASVFYTDQDSEGMPVGLQNRFEANTATRGSIKVLLLQKVEKSNEGVSDGLVTNAGGDQLIEADFNLTITP